MKNSKEPKNTPFELDGVTVAPGTRAKVELPLAQLYTQTPLNVPIHVIHGRKPGPVLMVSAAIHGDELNGVEIIRRLLRHSALKSLSGTLLAVPVVNVFGFIHKTRYLPDRRDLNRCFPGSETGSLGARMAWQFKSQVLDRATHAVDLHTGAVHRANLPQIRADLSNEGTAAMANAFGVPVVINSVLGEGTLREVAEAQGIPVITYEAGEALRFEESCIRAGSAPGHDWRSSRQGAQRTLYRPLFELGACRARWRFSATGGTGGLDQERRPDRPYLQPLRWR